MVLLHINSNVEFQYIETTKPQFSNTTFVKLLNLKTNKIEQFNASTYLRYFRAKEFKKNSYEANSTNKNSNINP